MGTRTKTQRRARQDGTAELRARMAQFVRENNLSIVLFGFFLAIWIGQAVAGWSSFNDEEAQHGRDAIRFAAYLLSPHFLEATAENWESEFLQMAAYVLLTVWLFQKGSAESKAPGAPDPAIENPARYRNKPGVPWPVRRGGWILKLYEHSLSLALGLLFLAAFILHAVSGAALVSAEHIQHGLPPVSVWQYVATAQFWFESFQNWQSEFFSVGVLAVLSIFLRQRGSPESKPVAAPHAETGD